MLRLRPYKKCDGDRITSWFTDEKSFYRWSADRYNKFPVTGEDMNEMYADDGQSDSLFPFTAFDEQGVVGHLIMRFTDERREEARFGFIVVDSEKRGKHYGSEMLRLAFRYAFDILKVKRVTLGVFDNNPDAVTCYKAVGFKPTGKSEEIELLGEKWTCIDMEIEEKEYRKLYKD